MSETGAKRLETWAQVGTVVVMIIIHMLNTEARLARVEQEVQDVKELIMHTHPGATE